MASSDPKFLTVADAARRVALSEKSVRRLIEAGRLKAYRPVPGRILLDAAELDSLVRRAGEPEAAR